MLLPSNTPKPIARRRRHRHISRRRFLLRLRIAGLLSAVALTTAAAVHFAQPDALPESQIAAGTLAPLPVAPHYGTLSLLLPAQPGRVVYPHSIVSGGVHSAGELEYAVNHDPVVAAHYATFDVSRARVVRLDKPLRLHVSYRLGNRVFWTKERRTIPAGEIVLSDGREVARTRCGNRLSEVAAPVSTEEPPEEVMEQPAEITLDPLDLLPHAVATSLNDVPPSPLTGPEPLPPFIFVTPPPPVEVVPVPEPGTAILLLGAGAAYAGQRLLRARRLRG